MQSQFGVVHADQASRVGMTRSMIRHRLDTGRWEQVHPCVFRIAGAPSTREQRAMAAVLYGGPGSVVVGRNAAALWDLAGGRWDPPEISSPRQLRRPGSPIVARRCTTLESRDVTNLASLPLTGLCRTVIDLCGMTDAHTSEMAFDQALRRGVSLKALRLRTEELGSTKLPGLPRVREFIQDRDPDIAMTDTELETLVNAWRKKFGFPTPVFQYWVKLPDYGPARLDFAYPDLMVGVEADSYAFHSGRAAFERDRARISEFASLGWIIIQTTWREIERYPERVANRLARALARSL
jgi:hypothetical protein